MIKFILFIFLLFLLLVFLLGFSLIRSAKNIFFGGGNGNKHTASRERASHSTQESSRNRQGTAHTASPRRRKKIFGKDEGEYVDYEEVKE